MTAPSYLSATVEYGPNADSVVDLMARVSSTDWFSTAGKSTGRAAAEKSLREISHRFGIDEYRIQWLDKAQLPSFLEGMRLETSPLWQQIHDLPDRIREKAEDSSRLPNVTAIAEHIPEYLFHQSFDGAFREFGSQGKEIVQTAVGSVMYLGGLACAWEMLADTGDWETNPYKPLLQVFETGHWPLGLYDGVFYLI